jgi:hypothetical protein
VFDYGTVTVEYVVEPDRIGRIPIAGEELYVSFRNSLDYEDRNPGSFSEEALGQMRLLDDSTWVVDRVSHCLTTPTSLGLKLDTYVYLCPKTPT